MSAINESSRRPAGNGGPRATKFERSAAVTRAFVCAGLLFAAAPVRAESMLEALNSTYRFNPRLDAARATLRGQDEEVARANAGYRPTINGTADVGYQNVLTTPNSPTLAGETHPRGYGISSIQPLFRGFRVVETVREAEAAVRAGRETLRTVEQTVLLDAITAYSDVVRDQAIVRLRENNVRVLSEELKATQDRFAVGEVTRTDVAQSEARRAGSVSALDLARSNLKTSRANFERSVGHPANNLREQLPLRKLIPRSLDEAIAISARENPALVNAMYREQGARHTIEKIRGELLPVAQLEAGYTRRFDPSPVLDETRTTSVVGRVTMPFYTGGEVEARVRQAKQNHLARLQEIEQNRTEVQAQVVTAWASFAAAQAQLVSDQATVDSNRVALTGVRAEERVGQRTLLEVLNAEQELLNAEVALVTTKRNLVVTSYTLIQTIGRLNIQELGAEGLVYDDQAHYFEVRRKWYGLSITHGNGHHEQLDLWKSHGEADWKRRDEQSYTPSN